MIPVVPLAIGLGAIVASAAAPLLRSRARNAELAAAKASARSVYHQLGFGVETVGPGDDTEAATALRQAEERWHTTGALLADAESVEACAVAEQTAMEGLAHVRAACRRLGIPTPTAT